MVGGGGGRGARTTPILLVSLGVEAMVAIGRGGQWTTVSRLQDTTGKDLHMYTLHTLYMYLPP